MEALIVAVSALSVMAFAIACTTLTYNVHEFRLTSGEIRHMSRELREGNERLAKLVNEGLRTLERMDKRQRNTTRILERIAERLK